MEIAVRTEQRDGETVQTVDARELHQFLEVGKDFSTWIKDRIGQYGFEEGRDFVAIAPQNGGAKRGGVSPKSGENSSGGRPRLEYHISLDMAKELSMVERNEKGKEARLYFIEAERRLRQASPDPVQLLSDPAAMRGLLLTYSERVIALEGQVADLAEKEEALDRISTADGSMCVTDAAKALQMRPKDLFAWLSQNGWIYKRTGAAHYLGYQSKTTAGLLEHKVTTVLRADGSEKVTEQVRVTAKGLTALAKLIKPSASAA